jgi:hypothetical protein
LRKKQFVLILIFFAKRRSVMEDELFAQLYRVVTQLANPRAPGQQYSDATILLVYFWAVLHDRPTNWASQQRHWPPDQRYWTKPSPSRMSRRLRCLATTELLQRVEARLRPPRSPQAALPQPLVKTIDAKPLVVGGFSKDRQATRGYVPGGQAKGYKLFALTDASGIIAWELHGLATSETQVARRLIPQLDGAGYLLADSLYDGNDLHDLTALCNHQLLSPRKKPHTGLGHQAHSPRRLRAIDLLEQAPRFGLNPFGPQLYRQRTGIERAFGHLGNFAAGLGPLPNWVRTLPRVRRWVHAKIIINALRLLNNQRLTA